MENAENFLGGMPQTLQGPQPLAITIWGLKRKNGVGMPLEFRTKYIKEMQEKVSVLLNTEILLKYYSL